MKPLVAVTGPDKRLKFGWWATRFMLFLVGLRSYYISAGNSHILPETRGVIIGGGDDIDPQHYGLTGDAGAVYDPERDALEMAVLSAVIEADIPVLGICRGSQLINVVLGGTLYSDIRPQRKSTPNRNTLFPIKWVEIKGNTRLFNVIQYPRVKVNSLHNQAVHEVGMPLVVAARDEDNFIQAVEHLERTFVVGVQWHPEYMPYSLAQRRIFKGFYQAVSNNRVCLPLNINIPD